MRTRLRLHIRFISFLAIICACALTPCAVLAAYDGDMPTFHGLLQSILLFAVPSAAIIFVTRKHIKIQLTAKDGFVLVFSSLLCMTFFCALPFILTQTFTNWADAFFEASSGITATCATMIELVEEAPRGMVLWRAIMSWLGGLGIVVLSVILMPMLGIGGVQLFRAEAGGLDKEKFTPRLTQTAKYILIIYLAFTIISILLLFLGGISMYDAVNHALSFISSGGFSTRSEGISYFKSDYMEWVLAGAMFVSGISFTLYYRLFTGKVISVFRNTEFRAYIFIVLSTIAIVAALNYFHGVHTDIHDSILSASFHVTSFISSTGASVEDYTLWSPAVLFVLLLLMFSGGCYGSTSGGFKVIRVVVLFKQALNEMRYLIHPRGVFVLRMNGASMSKEMVYSVSGFLFLYLLSIIIVAGVACTTGVDLVTALITGLAMIGNVGAGFGLVSPTEAFPLYPNYAKWVMSFAMIVGRLEIYTFFVFFMPFFWKK